MSSTVTAVYVHVIDDVVNKVRDEFINSGTGENVLSDLQSLWESKMIQCGAISGNIERPSLPKPSGPITPVHDLNVPYEGPVEEYETPTADLLFPPTPAQTPIQTPLPGTTDQPPYNVATPAGSADLNPLNDIRNLVDMKAARPSPLMQPSPLWMHPRPPLVDVNVAYVEGHDEVDRGVSHQPMTQDFFMVSSGKRKRDDYAPHLNPGSYFPQGDGSGDLKVEFFLPEGTQVQNLSTKCQTSGASEALPYKEANAAEFLHQADGINDAYDNPFPFQGVANEDYNTPSDHVDFRAGTPSVGTPKPSKGEAADDEEPPLNEDDDNEEDLDDLEQGEEEPNTQHLVLAQFDKVTRTKSRWKCSLKSGIMHLNNRDILFNKANGEFDF